MNLIPLDSKTFAQWIAPTVLAFAVLGCATNSEPEYAPLSQGDQALYQALLMPRQQNVQQALNNGANVNAQRPPDGIAPLHLAVADGKPELVELLLAHGAHVNVRTRKGSSPLHLAAMYENPAIALMLLAKKPDLNGQNQYGWTPAMEAARLGHIKTLKAILEAGADPLLKAKDGRDLMMFAASGKQNSKEMVEFLYKKGIPCNTVDLEGKTPLIHACLSNQTKTALFLLDLLGDFRPNTQEGIADLVTMKYAIYANEQDVVKKLIEKKIPLNFNLNDLYQTTKRLNTDGAYELLARNAIIKEGKFPLLWAAEKNNVDLIRLLLASGADPLQTTNAGTTAMQYATSMEAIRELKQAEEDARIKLSQKRLMQRQKQESLKNP